MFDQICYSGNDLFVKSFGDNQIPPWSWAQGLTCDNHSNNKYPAPDEGYGFMSTLAYAPLLAYCNMFSIYYLEVISQTKLLVKKNDSDSRMGKWVNFSVCGFYILLFSMIWIVQIVSNSKQTDGKQTSMFVYFMKCWFFKQKPWETPAQRKLTIFDFSYITMFFVQFIVLLMNLFVAKENLLIFTQEATN